jgi:hypothetical protein
MYPSAGGQSCDRGGLVTAFKMRTIQETRSGRPLRCVPIMHAANVWAGFILSEEIAK